MARYCILVVTLLFLILNATQACNEKLDFTKPECLSTMQGIKTAMECFSNATNENLLFQRENQDSMNTLTELVLQLKEQIAQQNVNIESIKKETTDLQRIDRMTQENQDLRTMVETKDTMVATLAQEIQDLKKKLETKNKTVVQQNEDDFELKISLRYCKEEVQDLDKKLQESLQKLNQVVVQCSVCRQPELQAVKTVVQQFNSNKDVLQLQRDLATVLDHESEASRLLQIMPLDGNVMYYLGYRAQTELVYLLLCAGLNVDTVDSHNNTILHGAAFAGSVQMVKFLLGHGATVDLPGQNQYTALMCAADINHLDVVKILIEAGASTTAKDYLGRTPLQIAGKYGTTAVTVYLQQFPH